MTTGSILNKPPHAIVVAGFDTHRIVDALKPVCRQLLIIAALQKFVLGRTDNRPPGAVLILEPLGIDPFKLIKMDPYNQPV